jgi:hypothetical protein
MTAPGNGFGAHNCDSLRLRKIYQIVQILPELRRLHIIGEATEAGVMPSGIKEVLLVPERNRYARVTGTKKENPNGFTSMSHTHSTCGLDKSEVAPAIADYAGPLLVRLPPSPLRSLGGYFNYEGWPDRQRFMELDEALRLKARENPPIWSKASSSAPKADSGDELEHEGEEVGQKAYCSSRGVNNEYTGPAPAEQNIETAGK